MALDKEALINELAGKVGRGVAEAAVEYLPTLQDMTLAELTALATLLAEGNYDAARNAIYDRMTAEELAADKERLAKVAELMAHDSYEAKQWGLGLIGGILKAALTALLSAAAF